MHITDLSPPQAGALVTAMANHNRGPLNSVLAQRRISVPIFGCARKRRRRPDQEVADRTSGRPRRRV